jgi:hypothetical protein
MAADLRKEEEFDGVNLLWQDIQDQDVSFADVK